MYFRWKPYVPVSARRQKAQRTAGTLLYKGQTLAPVRAGRGAIAKSFWGKAWCQNLERYSDDSNRLPRGRSYLRNGSVIDLKIGSGEVSAQVMGSRLYRITVRISEVTPAHWRGIARDCARSIDSMVELLQGQLSTSVMERITRSGTGLFPSPKEITFSCTCPDSASMCKHVAATLYGIGARLDAEPELLFGLRKVDAKELIARAAEGGAPAQKVPGTARILDASKIADVFGIDLAGADPRESHEQTVKKRRSPATRKGNAATRVSARSARKKSGKVR
jgi:uncharacterized Zn finger protein